ncbi:IS3 family transposase [Streptomyces sp. NPDC001296]
MSDAAQAVQEAAQGFDAHLIVVSPHHRTASPPGSPPASASRSPTSRAHGAPRITAALRRKGRWINRRRVELLPHERDIRARRRSSDRRARAVRVGDGRLGLDQSWHVLSQHLSTAAHHSTAPHGRAPGRSPHDALPYTSPLPS